MDRTNRFAKYYDQCRLPKWVMVLGVVLLAFGIVAAGVTAIFHDKYSSIFGAWETALTNVWFIAFVALVGVGALISLGYPLLTAIGSGLWALFSKNELEVIEEQPALDLSTDEGNDSAIEDNSKTITKPVPSTIDEDRLRCLLDTPYMHKLANGSTKNNLDRTIDDLRTDRIRYKKGAKDKGHFNDKNISEIARILYRDNFIKGELPSFADWCITMFECLLITPPDKCIISNNESSEHVKKVFNYLLS